MYDEDDDFEMYKSFYLDQTGGGLPHYSGTVYVPRQRGEGIGNFLLKTAGKILKPILLRGAKSAGKALLQSGTRMVTDLIDGKPLRETAKSRMKEGGTKLFMDLTSDIVRRTAAKASPTARKRKRQSKNPKRRKTIFDF